MTRAECYRHTRKRLWSLRVGGKVIDHLPFVALAGCRMTVRETERLDEARVAHDTARPTLACAI